jgi:hypothetical protein
MTVEREKSNAHLTLRWRGGLLSDLDVPLPRSHPATIRTAEDTVELLRRLAAHYPDTVIAGILNRQGRRIASEPERPRLARSRLCDPGPRQEVEETKLSRNRRGVGRLHSTDEASNKAD